jgi:hypothetical protein
MQGSRHFPKLLMQRGTRMYLVHTLEQNEPQSISIHRVIYI